MIMSTSWRSRPREATSVARRTARLLMAENCLRVDVRTGCSRDPWS